MERWKISHNRYLADRMNPKLRLAFWEGHRDFAYDLVHFTRPKRIVELGSQYGCSLFAFCQSVLDSQLDTQIHAVDFWSGDIGAGEDGETVLELVRKTAEEYFSSVDVRLHPMDFNEAVKMFEDGSIQMLHIDGGHTFEDVDNDFKTWLPKLDADGIILFHDIYSTIDQGSCDRWKHLKETYKNWFEFSHSCGLGILFPKGDYWYRKIQETDFEERCMDIYYYRALYEYTDIRYQELCRNYELRYEAVAKQDRMIDERDKAIASQEKMIRERDKVIASQEAMIKERDRAIASQEAMVKERDKAIASQEKMIQERDRAIASQEEMIQARDEAVKSEEAMIRARDEAIRSNESMIQERDSLIKKLEEELGTRG